jgi:hypothetical protein
MLITWSITIRIKTRWIEKRMNAFAVQLASLIGLNRVVDVQNIKLRVTMPPIRQKTINQSSTRGSEAALFLSQSRINISFMGRNPFFIEPDVDNAPRVNHAISAMTLQKANFIDDSNRVIFCILKEIYQQDTQEGDC